ncbi:hypothetical protein ACTXT7_017264, partial [Hymenolepis weldensis]
KSHSFWIYIEVSDPLAIDGVARYGRCGKVCFSSDVVSPSHAGDLDQALWVMPAALPWGGVPDELLTVPVVLFSLIGVTPWRGIR